VEKVEIKGSEMHCCLEFTQLALPGTEPSLHTVPFFHAELPPLPAGEHWIVFQTTTTRRKVGDAEPTTIETKIDALAKTEGFRTSFTIAPVGRSPAAGESVKSIRIPPDSDLIVHAADAPIEKKIAGKQVFTVEVRPHDDTQHSKDAWSQRTRYGGCRERYTCFRVPMPESTWRFLAMHSAEFRRHPRSLLEVFHGMRLIWKDDGSSMRIENYYAGVKHGMQLKFRDGKLVGQAEFRFGDCHGDFKSLGEIGIEAYAPRSTCSVVS
jgi:hypothetical protein